MVTVRIANSTRENLGTWVLLDTLPSAVRHNLAIGLVTVGMDGETNTQPVMFSIAQNGQVLFRNLNSNPKRGVDATITYII